MFRLIGCRAIQSIQGSNFLLSSIRLLWFFLKSNAKFDRGRRYSFAKNTKSKLP